MAIVHMGSSFDYTEQGRVMKTSFHDGEYCPLPKTNGMNDHVGADGKPAGDTIYMTHHGLCLSEREANFYDDSDFYMRVWDVETQSIKEICFASTRGWTYPCLGSYVDATPEIVALATAYQIKVDRLMRARNLIWDRRRQTKEVAELGLQTRKQLKRLENCGIKDDVTRLKTLLKTKKFRSEFRAKMAAQVRDWINDPQPKYATPLSPKQMQYI